jgi:uncharacterized protein (UPF0210 family)
MRIRSVTIGTNASYPIDESRFGAFTRFQARARELFEGAGLEVQTVRIATQPFPEILQDVGPAGAVAFARDLEALCQAHGIDFCSIGTVPAADRHVDPGYIAVIPEVIRQTEVAFASVSVATPERGINLAAVEGAAEAIVDIAHSTPDGFGNLRLAILANCEPGSPFFPAAYHRGPGPAFSVATEAADLAVDAFGRAATLEEASGNLRRAVEHAAGTISEVSQVLVQEFGLRYGGIDFSLAPYPETTRSIGHALEALGVDAFGSSGTLFAVAFATRVLREARFPRCGFSGLLLPVLEDQTLAERSTEDLYTLDSLLLYSAVCGTGLDTIPLPGDVSVRELAAILLDVATLALVANKPLTARLMPVPGKGPGEFTEFDFAYFANARILDTRGRGAAGLFARGRQVRL